MEEQYYTCKMEVFLRHRWECLLWPGDFYLKMSSGRGLWVYDDLEEGVSLSLGESSREVCIPAPDMSEGCTCIMSLR